MNISSKINYKILSDAIEYYKSEGYKEINVPWIINHEEYYATKLDYYNRDFYTLDGYLPASGEQSFISLMLSDVTLGKSICVTPCFRDDAEDYLHQKYFIKAELIDTNYSFESLEKMIADAVKFFSKYLEVEVVSNGLESYDIIDSKYKIELGSYGRRTYKSKTGKILKWVYGTGVALPRLEIVINKTQNENK